MRARFSARLIVTASVVLAALAGGGALLANHIGPNDLGVSRPWGPADQDTDGSGNSVLGVTLTYEIKAGRNVPQTTIDAVQLAIDLWNAKINGEQSGWTLDLVPLAAGGVLGGGNPIHACHKGGKDPKGCGDPGNGGGNGEATDIEIQVKNGGGLIAGSAKSFFDADGFRVKTKIQVSGRSFGLTNSDLKVQEITMHELAHALGDGHHGDEDDLMGQTVGDTSGNRILTISQCDVDGVTASHHWLTHEKTTTPHLNHVNKITCPHVHDHGGVLS